MWGQKIASFHASLRDVLFSLTEHFSGEQRRMCVHGPFWIFDRFLTSFASLSLFKVLHDPRADHDPPRVAAVPRFFTSLDGPVRRARRAL